MEQTPQRAPRDTSPAKRPQYPARRPGNRILVSVRGRTQRIQRTVVCGAALVLSQGAIKASCAEPSQQPPKLHQLDVIHQPLVVGAGRPHLLDDPFSDRIDQRTDVSLALLSAGEPGSEPGAKASANQASKNSASSANQAGQHSNASIATAEHKFDALQDGLSHGFSLVFGVVGLVCSLIGFVAGFACCALITAIYWLLA